MTRGDLKRRIDALTEGLALTDRVPRGVTYRSGKVERAQLRLVARRMAKLVAELEREAEAP